MCFYSLCFHLLGRGQNGILFMPNADWRGIKSYKSKLKSVLTLNLLKEFFIQLLHLFKSHHIHWNKTSQIDIKKHMAKENDFAPKKDSQSKNNPVNNHWQRWCARNRDNRDCCHPFVKYCVREAPLPKVSLSYVARLPTRHSYYHKTARQ